MACRWRGKPDLDVQAALRLGAGREGGAVGSGDGGDDGQPSPWPSPPERSASLCCRVPASPSRPGPSPGLLSQGLGTFTGEAATRPASSVRYVRRTIRVPRELPDSAGRGGVGRVDDANFTACCASRSCSRAGPEMARGFRATRAIAMSTAVTTAGTTGAYGCARDEHATALSARYASTGSAAPFEADREKSCPVLRPSH